ADTPWRRTADPRPRSRPFSHLAGRSAATDTGARRALRLGGRTGQARAGRLQSLSNRRATSRMAMRGDLARADPRRQSRRRDQTEATAWKLTLRGREQGQYHQSADANNDTEEKRPNRTIAPTPVLQAGL